MKNDEIHSGLDKGEIRNFISENITLIQKQINQLKTKIVDRNGKSSIDVVVERCTYEVEYFTKRLDLYKKLKSVLEIMKICGWEEFDVSDDITKVGDDYLSFIGTDEDYGELMIAIHEHGI